MSEMRVVVPDVGELTFWMVGEPGERVIYIRRHDGVSYGRMSYRDFMKSWHDGSFGPGGDVVGCDERDLALVCINTMQDLRLWAEGEALGKAATGEEAYE